MANESIEQLIAGASEDSTRKLAALENLRSIDDPIISELIESLRKDIAFKKELVELLTRSLAEARPASSAVQIS